MKNSILLTFILLISLAFRFVGDLSKEDRTFAVEYLKQTETNVVNKVKGLSPEQLSFKPYPDSWSIAQCIEHIALSEDFIFSLSQQALDGAIESVDPAFDNETLIQVITDRSSKTKTFDALQPGNTYENSQEALDAFRKSRDAHISYLKRTQDPLLTHYHKFPFGYADAYQVILFMAAHTERHTLQIEEVMDHPDFPK
ncbi:MAG: DinB family protein [Bacteroidota bacterium]